MNRYGHMSILETMAVYGDVVGESRAERFASAERRIGRATKVLDELIEVPGTSIKIGLDPVIGLIPVVGDAVSALAGGWVILEASRFGVPRIVLARMILNLTVDLAIGLIPFLGDLYDFVFHSNSRNLELFRRHALDPSASTRGEQALFIGLALLIVGIIWLVVSAVGAFLGWLGSTRI
jgi:uncharacterized protein DUF4112